MRSWWWDATQAAGAAPIDVRRLQPDFLAFPTYKWVLGSYSLAFLYAAKRWQDGEPLERNGFNCVTDEACLDVGFAEGARRYDMGERNNPVAPADGRGGAPAGGGVGSGCRAGAAARPDRPAGRGGAGAAAVAVRPREMRVAHILGVRVPGGMRADTLDRLAAAGRACQRPAGGDARQPARLQRRGRRGPVRGRVAGGAGVIVEQLSQPAPGDRAAISAAMDVHNDARTGRPEPATRVGVFVRDAESAVIGGAWCVAYWDWLHVDLLHLPEALRGQGIGTRVMRGVERAAARLGCIGVWLDTATFQAPGFYRKLGFSVFGGIAGFVPGHDRLFLLRREPRDGDDDDPGIEVVHGPDEADRATILTGLIAFNDSMVGPSESAVVGLVVREHAAGPVLGGLWGRRSRHWLFVELLVLPEHARGQRLGTELMGRAEALMADIGGMGVWLDTFSFQARPFYEKRGYRVFGEIPDYPAPHRRFLLARRVDGGTIETIPPDPS